MVIKGLIGRGGNFQFLYFWRFGYKHFSVSISNGVLESALAFYPCVFFIEISLDLQSNHWFLYDGNSNVERVKSHSVFTCSKSVMEASEQYVNLFNGDNENTRTTSMTLTLDRFHRYFPSANITKIIQI